MSYCDDILKRSKELHLDECEAVHVQRNITTVRITDSEIAEAKHSQDESVAIRVIDKKKIISARSPAGQEGLLDRALETRSFARPRTFWKALPPPSKKITLDKVHDPRLEWVSETSAIDIANEMINSSRHGQITRISGSLNIVSERFHVMNTSGLDCADKSTFIAGTINTESESGSVPVSGIGAASSRTIGSFSAQKIGRDASEMCVSSINPRKVEPDSYQIIFEPYAFGDLLSFVFSANFGLKTYSEKRSCFSGRLGDAISSGDLTVMDDPHAPEGIGSKPFDDEGTTTRPRPLVKSGVFSGLFSDSFEAFKNGTSSSGNAARPGLPIGRSAQPLTVPLPHNLRVMDGSATRDEMIRETKKGIIVGRLWYTYPINPEQGDFSCTARSGIRIIENGSITGPGRPVRIVHNLKSLLMGISLVGNDSRNVLQWHSLPSITPTVMAGGIRATPL